ncbi:MAG TPA: bacillithiol biosynthesis cysteine-adding enzyme BshC [Vicinamibacterales bacterium]|nr:bacillithiol biosynthesis cysteine-adding enzyme BshC [Vicinamibacterales bacterium]
MTGPSDTSTVADIVRAALDVRDFPGSSPFVRAYTRAFDSVSPLFAGNPADPSAWRAAIRRAHAAQRDPKAIAGVLTAQLERRGAVPEACAMAARLADPNAVTIVTGQQSGAFGGPLYTLLKAITTLQLARQVEAQHGVPVVPIFWADGEDHDWQEIRATSVITGGGELAEIAMPHFDGAGERRSGDIVLDERIAGVVDALFAALPSTEFSAGLRAAVARCYEPGRSMAEAYARLIEHLLGRHGLVVFESADAAAKPLARELFAGELRHPGRSSRLAAAAGDRSRALGFPPQVVPVEGSPALFQLTPAREAIRVPFDGAALAGDALAHPERFSPNVLLRPVVQDWIFPNIAYVAGPGELAYHGQLEGIYKALGVPRPLVYPRASASIMDAQSLRFLDRHAMPLASLAPPGETALNQLIDASLPGEARAALVDAAAAIGERWNALAEALPRIDPTLEGAARGSLKRLQHEIDTLQWKTVRAVKRREADMRRQFRHAQQLAFPRGTPQERVLGVVYFANQYGPALVDKLIAELPAEMGSHWVVTI